MVHQNLAHDARGDGVKMRAVLVIRLVLIGQAQVQFMNYT
jgi:hypothetical protein